MDGSLGERNNHVPMLQTYWYALGVLFQVAAVIYALLNARGLRRRRPWLVLTAGFSVMLIYRVMAMLVSTDPRLLNRLQTTQPQVSAGISFLLFLALFLMRRMALAEERSSHAADRAQRALGASEELNRSVLASMSDCVTLLDMAGRVLMINEVGRRLMEMPPDYLPTGKSWVSFWPDDQRGPAAAALEKARSGSAGAIEGFCPTLAGTPRTWSATVTAVLGMDNRPQRLLVVSRDITDRIQAESERLRLLESERAARAEAERTSRLKDDFLATVSHELRTPLNAILGWSQIMKQENGDPQSQAEALTVIERNARAQAQLIGDLLDMSRIIAGKVRLDLQPGELGEMIELAVQTVRSAADLKGVMLQSELAQPALMVTADRNRMQQVFWNLLTNAIKFTPRGGRVMVAVRQGESHVEISVSDSGQGISSDFLPHVFERFRQADSSTTRRHGGLGIGLSIVKNLVELHGGSVSVASSGTDLGSVFTVRLPLPAVAGRSAGNVLAPDTTFATSDELRNVRVLVVDDEADSLLLVQRVLERCGAVVTTAASVNDAMDAMGAFKPDLILSDIGMPDLDGYEFIRRVREDLNGSRIPAAALTALVRPEDRARALQAGFQQHVAKPVDPAELITIVKSLSNGATAPPRLTEVGAPLPGGRSEPGHP